MASKTNQSLGMVLAGLGLIALLAGRLVSTDDSGSPPPTLASTAPSSVDGDRTLAPAVAGRVLPTGSTAPEPKQWEGGEAGIPTAQWWSSALVGPGTRTMWAHPLAVAVDPTGEIAFAAPLSQSDDDGTSVAPFVPALFLRPLDEAIGSVRVVDAGAFHVSLAFEQGDGSLSMTILQGSPFVEFEAAGRLTWLVPGLQLDVLSDRVIQLSTSEGTWMLASHLPMQASAVGDELTIVLAHRTNLVLGPEYGDQWADEALAIAAAPLLDTDETLTVGRDGSVTQRLSIARDGDVDSLFVLRPHQSDLVGPDLQQRLAGDRGALIDLVTGTDLDVEYPSVPLLWGPTVTRGHRELADLVRADLEVVGPVSGSYFAGKEALRLAQLGQLAVGAGSNELATEAFDRLEVLLADLVGSGGSLELTWDPQWGSVVLQPAEFGAGSELNDHSLQYGYWVAAAATFEENRPGAVVGLRDAIDLLVGDYGGARLFADSWDGLAENRTWSPYEGHSWASGLAPFDAGNNLESVSESAHAWWASARWLMVTDRADESINSVARFTIESFLATTQWLPIEARTDNARPWTGVVWSSKVDNETWFDQRHEAALGIRLLPLTPGSLARYATASQQEAAANRWQWCSKNGACVAYWSNLLDSDAAAAGLPPLSQLSESEPSTSQAMAFWWRQLVERDGLPSERWSCPAGIVALETTDGSVSAIGSTTAGGTCLERATGVETLVPAGVVSGLSLP